MVKPSEERIAHGRIHCRVQPEADGARCYTLQIPTQLVPVAEACIRDLMSGRYHREVAAEADLVSAAVAALQRLLERVRQHWHTGQSRRIVAFLAGLYNGQDYPFDLTELRGVDQDIAEDCLAVLRLDTRGLREVHRYIEGGEATWAAMITDYGLKVVGRSSTS